MPESASSDSTGRSPLSEWEKIPPLDGSEQSLLFDLLEKGAREDALGNSIRGRLVRAHLPLVLHETRAFRGLGVSIADLAQEGCLALISAVDQFDGTRHPEFFRYAGWLIRRRLRRVIRSRRESARGLAETEDPFLDELEDTETGDPYSIRFRVEVEERAHALLRTLTEDEERVLRLRFGIGPTDPQTLQEIGRLLGIDPKRVSRLESHALGMLRKTARRFRDVAAE
jgi:RNA polymerase sigma factor (sigma-70 family)